MTHTTRTHTIGAPPAPLLARESLSDSQKPRTDRTDGRTDTICPMDTSIKSLVAQLADHLRTGNVSNGQIRDVSNGQIYIFHVTRPDLPDRGTRLQRCVTWMREHQITNREAFFSNCPDATPSAALHSRCIKQLKREGLIEKIGREYVFKD